MKTLLPVLVVLASVSWAQSQIAAGILTNKHSASSRYPSYEGRILCGYQGWFRAEGDGSGRGWVHYGAKNQFDPDHCTVDLWPDVSEYEKTYPTAFKMKDGSPARVFSSWDESTVDLHFRWMQQYGVDGVFMQRFFGVTRTEKSRSEGRVILGHALKASQKHERAIAVMYDLSGLKPGEDCASVIQDWKELVDELKLTSQGTNQTYLYHRGKPLVAIWGIGFPDRPYNIHNIGLEKLIDFLKHDPEYGGCSVMLGVPTYFRELRADCTSDPYLHELIAQVAAVISLMGAIGANHIDESDPPVFIAHGTSDNLVPYMMVKNMVEKLEKVNANYSFYPVDGVAHRLQTILDTEFDGKTVRDHSLDFCFEAMKLGKLIKESR